MFALMFQLRKRIQQLAERIALSQGAFRWDPAEHAAASGRLVFVCSGNICRTPYAEFVARAGGLTAISCGTDTRNDLPAAPTAIAEAMRRGTDMTSHRSKRWQDVELRQDDTIIAVQLGHARAVQPRARVKGCKVVIMSALLLPDFDVVWDPYGGPVEAYRRSFDLIDRAIGRLIALRTAAS
jgi:protein-tyrosine phosphatase